MARSHLILTVALSVVGARSDSQSCYAVQGDESEMCTLLQTKLRARDEPQEAAPPPDECGEKFEALPYGEQQLWGSAFDTWEKCSGKVQSPVALRRLCKHADTTSPLSQSFGIGSELHLVNNGNHLEVEGYFGNVSVDGLTFASKNIHFHTPSEHTVNGVHAAMEMHIVSKSGDQAAVVGILFDIGAHNLCLEGVLDKLPIAGCKREAEPIDLECFSRQLSGSYWSYLGSLTTPPCTEGIRWAVMERVATISKEQWLRLRQRYTNNNRVTQPLNGRQVLFHDTDSAKGGH